MSSKINPRYSLFYKPDRDLSPLRVRPSTGDRFPDCNAVPTPGRKITYFPQRALRSNTYVTYEQFRRIYERAAIPQVTQFWGRADEASSSTTSSFNGRRQWGQQALNKLKALQSRKPSMESFIQMLGVPSSRRPTTLAECIDFFYPESGVLAIEGDNSPFIGTLPFQYDVDPNQVQNTGGDLPLQLGEVTMMYGWFILFRQLLCQKNEEVSSASIPPDPASIFEPVGESGFLLTADKLFGAHAQIKDKIDKLLVLQQVAGYTNRLIKSAVRLAEEHEWDLGNFLDSQKYEALVEQFKTKGATLIASSISSQIGLPSKYANDISTFLLEGKLDNNRFGALTRAMSQMRQGASLDRSSATETYRVLKELIEKQVSSAVAGPDPATYKRSPIFKYSGVFVPLLATKDPTKLDQLKQDLEQLKMEPGGVELYRRAIAWVEQELENERSRFKENFVDGMSPRENAADWGVTAALVAIDVVFDVVQGGIEYRATREAQRLESMRNYLYTNVFRLNASLITGLPYDFSFFTHVRSGLRSARIPPTCELQQGGQMLDYWTSTFAGLRNVVINMRNATTSPSARKGKAEADIVQDAFLASNFSPLVPYIKLYEKREGDRKKVCAGMRYLAQSSLVSALKVLQTLHYFSPFTHAFGFAPVFEQPSRDFISFIDGTAARTYLGPSNVTSWSVGQASAPYRTNFYTHDGAQPEGHVPQNAAVTEEEVECWVGVTPMPSRRTLEGAFGGRASVSFDTAFGNIPVMDAQYCALMSVLFLYKDARDTIRNSTLSWRTMLPPEPFDSSKWGGVDLSMFRTSAYNFLRFNKSALFPSSRNTELSPGVIAMIHKGVLSTQRQELAPAQKLVRTLAVSASLSALVYAGWKWRKSQVVKDV